MVSDSIPNASMASSNLRDFAKKKRANRSAKLKQCKLDARREQWLSHVKNKGDYKGEANGGVIASIGASVHLENQTRQPIGKLEIKTKSEEGIYGDVSSMHHFSDSDSVQSNSPTSLTSSVLGSNDSGANFTGSSSSRSSSSTNGSCSGNMSEEDEGDAGGDDCLDDWEAVADALAATDDKQKDSPSSENHERSTESGSPVDASDQMFSGINIPGIHTANANSESGRTDNRRAMINCCAWRPDDACRPQTLPNLAKQYSFPLKSERHLGGGSVWVCKSVGAIPKACPICFEDLDYTDSSFCPCACGFRLCLFCHKRILEEDARCPGCRKKYEVEPIDGEATLDGGSITYRLARSCSMVARS
ncbi:uncharacterized protein LOC125189107 [Salvia hispanica]|uniref:uncharacterized protein LOC125189107 n=1 Tax=Salvia hispanica TaxID=49212 RepID=UPI002009A08D|nr:uncharacterized protein LOC125189107 [Salvia hispanica]XP_047942269.1 uncharacterized protein LOC125189107 [Salvia hispanica]XP_047942270.1 uncharacterized protein LOC125189107 [Salvia hispanica]